jgi:hypothetical protein
MNKYRDYNIIPHNSSTAVGLYAPTLAAVAQSAVNQEVAKRSVTDFPKFGYVRYTVVTSDTFLMKRLGLTQAILDDLKPDSNIKRIIMFVELNSTTPITYGQFIAGKATEEEFKGNLLKLVLPLTAPRAPEVHEKILLKYSDSTDLQSAQFDGYINKRGLSLDPALSSYKKGNKTTKNIMENSGA